MNGPAAAQPVMTDAANDLQPDRPADSRGGVVSAAEVLVSEHGARIRRLVERLTAWSPDAADLTQDVFAAALLALPNFRGECTMATWLTQIAIHRCRRWHRRQRLARWWRNAAASSPHAQATSDASALERQETNAAVRRAVASLPAKYREVVVMRFLEEKSSKETAMMLRLRVNTVDVRLHRAKALLADALANVNEAS